jgi:predicted NUDIX family NTP pyrophosphohydrolase
MPKMSAGILPYRVVPDGAVEVLLAHPGGPFWKHKDEHAWSVVKGEYQAGEDPEQAAEREFTEELGCAVPVGLRADLGEVRQAGGKRVRVWAIRADELSVENVVSNEFEMEWPPGTGRSQSFPEIDRAEWMSVERARGRLVRGQEALLDRLRASLAGE